MGGGTAADGRHEARPGAPKPPRLRVGDRRVRVAGALERRAALSRGCASKGSRRTRRFVAALNACARGREGGAPTPRGDGTQRRRGGGGDGDAGRATAEDGRTHADADADRGRRAQRAAGDGARVRRRPLGDAQVFAGEAAVALLRRMQTEERCPPPNLLCFIADRRVRRGGVGPRAVAPARQALALWAEMLDESAVVPDALCASYVADACASAGQWAPASRCSTTPTARARARRRRRRRWGPGRCRARSSRRGRRTRSSTRLAARRPQPPRRAEGNALDGGGDRVRAVPRWATGSSRC